VAREASAQRKEKIQPSNQGGKKTMHELDQGDKVLHDILRKKESFDNAREKE